jgi:hypothetical protein
MVSMRINPFFRILLFCLVSYNLTAQPLAGINADLAKQACNKPSTKPHQLVSLRNAVANAEYFSVISTGELNWDHLPQPQVALDHATLLESQFNMDCNAGTAFSAYFAPERWAQTSKPSAESKIELLLETENSQYVAVESAGKSSISFVAPALGSINFEVSHPEALQVFQGDRKVYILNNQVSAFLQAGQVLRIELIADAKNSVKIGKFQYLSELSGIITREWRDAQQQVVFQQVIGLERPSLNDIRFPKMAKVGRDKSPEATGFPLIDSDGDLQSTSDQLILFGSFNNVNVSYQDRISDDKTRIFRTWTVRDDCADNTMSEIQELILPQTSTLKAKAPAKIVGKSNAERKVANAIETGATLPVLSAGAQGL